ncbi:hypothetical protein SAMN05444003_0559 [Cognatiyoonia sediminum]|uniref:Uncharacterized protein n=1 Tax=Cognatiyoonia sediminum TaxID=1508389 RepID=A0A1M5M073_9RHOB|nr:hypothetical protein [Cognatiyoonia sediminum]SHG70329.1 hypothetical protein SAMN05444003_0559 [Cognatiyoonia sediminum]
MNFVVRFTGSSIVGAVLFAFIPSSAIADCAIAMDVSSYFEKLEMANIVTQYGNQVVRATDGAI